LEGWPHARGSILEGHETAGAGGDGRGRSLRDSLTPGAASLRGTMVRWGWREVGDGAGQVETAQARWRQLGPGGDGAGQVETAQEGRLKMTAGAGERVS